MDITMWTETMETVLDSVRFTPSCFFSTRYLDSLVNDNTAGAGGEEVKTSWRLQLETISLWL